jgi:hypothetical protein
MHLIEQYALSCGVKIDKPHIETCFYPIAENKYITLHASSGMQAKNYDYYNDVMEMILPHLNSQGIKVIQIGGKEDKSIRGCEHLHGRTNIKQSAYIIQNSLLHFGNDSFSTHVASGFNKKIVCLYSVLFKECCGPYWGDKENQILIESHRNGLKPSFSDSEEPKMVNLIKPEEIASSILKLLKIENTISEIETLHLGAQYHIPAISVVPNHIMPASFAKGQPVNIWGHECFDEQNIAKWAYDRKCNIFLNKPMGIRYLDVIRKNINRINYFVSHDSKESYFKSLEKGGVRFNLLCKDENIINELRLKFFDWPITLLKEKTKKDLDNSEKLCNNSRYKNSMKIISGGQIYSSKAAWKNELEGEHDQVIDCPEFWEEIDTLKIYNDKNHGKNKDIRK